MSSLMRPIFVAASSIRFTALSVDASALLSRSLAAVRFSSVLAKASRF